MQILIAEDDLTSRKILGGYLKKWGYEVTATADGEQAWEVLQSDNCPQLAILDWEMPGYNGVELCKKFRELNRSPYVYILLLTGKDLQEDIVAGLGSGADDYLTKPFDISELKERLQVGRRIIELENQLHRQIQLVTEANEKLHRDLEAAANVQKSLLPSRVPHQDSYDFSWFYEPSEYLGGDMLNIVEYDERYVICYVIDVSGHGVPSALLSVTVRNQLGHSARSSQLYEVLTDPAVVMTQLSQHFQDLLTSTELYFTMLYGVLDTQEHTFTFTQAGHPYPLIHSKDGAVEMQINSNIPVGFMATEYVANEVSLGPGDALYVYTDGITEAGKEGDPEQYGLDRFLEQIANEGHGNTSDPKESIEVVREWQGGGSFLDDVSLIRVTRRS